VFPHHENEIAQTRCAFHTAVMANYWLHNGFLQVEGEKMAKSAGNFVTIRELLENWHGYSWPGEALRFNMLRTHYRQPIDWTYESLDESHKILWDWYGDISNLKFADRVSIDAIRWLCDDLNTAQLITELHNLRRKKELQSLRDTLQFLGFSGRRENLARIASAVGYASGSSTVTGISGTLSATEGPDKTKIEGKIVPTVDKIEKLIAMRNTARRAKNYKESDRIRDELAAMGVVLKDSKDGTTWEIAR
jgi:cysteinyl-tRNA synthetase